MPLFTFLALRSLPDTTAMTLFLIFIFVGSVIALAIMFGLGHFVTRQNVGIWQRINTGISIPWMAVLGYWLLRRPADAAIGRSIAP